MQILSLIQIEFTLLFRVLLDRYAACKSSKEVVEVQKKWLQECQEEHEAGASQGMLSDFSYMLQWQIKLGSVFGIRNQMFGSKKM